jgi:hypothetical protein
MPLRGPNTESPFSLAVDPIDRETAGVAVGFGRADWGSCRIAVAADRVRATTCQRG